MTQTEKRPAPNKDIRQSIFGPEAAAQAGQDFAEQMAATSEIAIPLYLKNFDFAIPEKKFTPMRGGTLISVMMSNSNGKTSFAIWHAVQRANWLMSQYDKHPEYQKRAVVLVTAEVMVETLVIQLISCQTGIPYASALSGSMDLDQIKQFKEFTAYKLPNMPIWVVGHSSTRKIAGLKISDVLVEDSLTEIENWLPGEKHLIDICYVDFLQMLILQNREDLERNADKVGVTSQLVKNLKMTALNHDCVLWLNTQARREAEQANGQDKMPGPADSAWSADLERFTDILLTAWKPSKYHRDGLSIKIFGDLMFTVTAYLWLIKLVKHRFGPNGIWHEINYNAAIASFEVPIKGQF